MSKKIIVALLLAMTLSSCGGECGNWEYHQVCREISKTICDYTINGLTIEVSDGEGNLIEEVIPDFEESQTGCNQVEAALSDGSSIRLGIYIPSFESPDFQITSYSETSPEGEVITSTSQTTDASVEESDGAYVILTTFLYDSVDEYSADQDTIVDDTLYQVTLILGSIYVERTVTEDKDECECVE